MTVALPATSDPIVVVLDTGVDASALPAGVVMQGCNFSGEGDSIDFLDRNGHGTAIGRTIVDEFAEVRLLPIKLLVDLGYLPHGPGLEDALEWILHRHQTQPVAVVCASFSDGSHTSDDDIHRGSRLQELVAALKTAGVPTVAPAGNRYIETSWRDVHGMAWPAILRETVSVGALRPLDDDRTLRIAPRSQRLHRSVHRDCATNVFAVPGPPGDTSGAAAVVAGRLARLRGRCPGATCDELVQLLMRTQTTEFESPAGLTWPALEP
ncbi:S8/S53 family peptidase [Stieleria varia]|uniref:Peptidase S8/S53 domain-containing protein n=1 Tax=Stieleria varia TaxID=2528005 RepID=A0A5C6AP55_9BACT|nr:S8/S53 family peptidase [Stieleria varia]TWU00802.1 hypothetical protein Pla52n_41710 [Stieleria varia]